MPFRTPSPVRGDPVTADVPNLLRPAPGELGVVWTLWLTYGAFYFCRTNLSAAVPGMETSLGAGGLGLTSAQVRSILAALKLAYGLGQLVNGQLVNGQLVNGQLVNGQLVNGQLAERFSPRLLLALGMFGSAGLNVLFGFGTGFYFLLFVWAMNGYCQSLGWPPTVRVVGNWVPVLRRGKASASSGRVIR